MRIGISNIAWDRGEDEQVAQCLKRYHIDSVDIAASKYFDDVSKASSSEIAAVRQWWSTRGFEITGMQSLLFGTTGLNLFGSRECRASMLSHLEHICRIGGGLGGTRLVFGSPRNRDRGQLSDHAAEEIAFEFFGSLGDLARKWGVTICLEPNPARYGANFLLNAHETASFVRTLDHDCIKMQFDTGALQIADESAAQVLRTSRDIIGHIHLSEPDLVPLGDGDVNHKDLSALLDANLPAHVATIEMVATRSEPHLNSIERALKAAIGAYRRGQDVQEGGQ